MTAGCAACGRCCDPVVLLHEVFTAQVAAARRDDVRDQPNAVFIAQHWHPVSARVDPDGVVRMDLRCDAFDPETRMCTAREKRPPVCREYPWYGDDPADVARYLHPECSYLLDVQPSARPEGARPLIPITPVRG